MVERREKTITVNGIELTLRERSGFDLVATYKLRNKRILPIYGLAVIVAKASGKKIKWVLKNFTAREMRSIADEVFELERFEEDEKQQDSQDRQA